MNGCIKWNGRALLTLMMVLGVNLIALPQQKFNLFRKSSLPLPEATRKEVRTGIRLEIAPNLRQHIYDTEPESFALSFPLPDGRTRELTFYRKQVVSDDFKVTTSDGKELKGKEFSGVHYQINPDLQEEKFGVLSFSQKEMMGIISDGTGNWNLGVLKGTEGDYILYNEQELTLPSNFHCETEDKEDPLDKIKGKGLGGTKSVQTTGTCKTVKMYFECDFRMYQDNGNSTTNTTNRTTGIFNAVKQLYANEQIDIELGQVFVWTSADPYATMTSAFTVLSNFAVNRSSISQTLGHFISTRPASMGGIAYINVLCNPAAKFGFSNIYNSYNAVPTYSWTVSCIAHELGHNFGSRHTHWCGWQLTPSTIGRIDSCYAGETVSGAVNCSNTTKANFNGTIMSYCHVNGAINFNRGFGPLPGNLMRSNFGSATCITGSPVPQFSLSGTRVTCAGGNVDLRVNTSVTGATFNWTGPNGYTSSAQNPALTNVTAAASGNYSCTVSKSGCTSDPKSVPVVVNAVGTPPINESFAGTFLPPNWRISNPNGDVTFVKNASVGGFGTSNCVSIDNYNLPFSGGKRDTLFLPVVDLTGLTGASMSFDVAHAWNTVSFDSLSVVVSTNCGRSFSRIFRKTGTALATAPSTFNAFVPTSTQWRKETLSLAAYEGMGQVQIAFVNVSGGTNFLYLDNINVTTSGGTGSPSISLGSLSQSSYCPGASFNVSFTPSGTFNSGNNFTVQLSNSSGSFTSPTVVGSGTGSPVSVTIPAGTATGSNYLIRVVASNPSVTSSPSPSLSIAPLTVNAGTDRTVCSNGSNLTLSGTPSGGTWSGSGVSAGGTFTPSAALVGTRTLTYSVNSGGCSGSDNLVITVNAAPAVNAGSNSTTCSGSPAFALSGFSPAGGTWSGNGVSSGGTFTPSAALLGTQTLTYSVVSNGCTGTDTKTVTVNSTLTVSAGPAQTVCSNGSAITLSGSPAGGTWSGSGVTSSGVFTPGSGLIGTQTLTYTVSGSCAGSNQTTVTVNAAPTVNAGIDQSFCSADAPYSIVQGSPSGGTWSGPGVSGGIFNPSPSLVGTHSLTYSVTQNGCTGSSTVDFSVNLTPSPSAGANQSICTNSSPVTLTGSPAGGTWGGTGINGSGLFNPSAANSGPNLLTYSLTQNGCTGTGTMTMTVNLPPTVDAGPDQSASASADPVTLNGLPAGGTWSGTGVTSGGVFSPGSSGQGSFSLTYSVLQGGCTGSDELIFVVLPSATVSAGGDISLCESAGPATLTGSPAGGTWSGNGVSPEGIFTPSSALIGSQTLTYTVSGIGTDEMVVVVNPSPTVSAGTDQTVCSSSPNFTLTGGSPTGGTWSGSGISSAGLVTTSLVSSSGSVFTYSYSLGGCTGSASVTITSVSPPSVNAGANQNICKNATPVQLSGSPTGGTWSGSGVSSTGLFNPASVSNGNKTLTYTVAGSIPGCSGSDQMVMSVFNIPTVTAGTDRTTCSNSAPFALTGTPTGGTWSGAGVSGSGLFTPVSSLVGIQTLTYSVTQNGCSNSSTLNVTVNALPTVNAGSNRSICTNTGSFDLSGMSPAGGTWSGPGFVSGSGNCTGPFTAGNYTLTYTVTENGCTSSDQISIGVNPVPTVEAGTNRSVCSNGNSLTLTGFSPANGVWSGNGVSSAGVFSPSASLTGVQTLTYSVTQNGCTGSDNLSVTVKAIPAITTGANETSCASGIRFKINGYSPRGGRWTGPGIVQDSLFSPSQSLVGTQTITYTVSKNGCTNSSQKTVTVTPSTVITAGTYPSQICANGLPTNFSGFQPSGGIWKGAGMAPNGLLTPSSQISGNQTYTYRVDLNGCRDSIQVQTDIKSLPVVNAGPDLTACATGASVALNGATPSGGIWVGQGVTDSGIFSPTAVSPGIVSLAYNVVSPDGCTGSDAISVNVSAAPTVSGGPDRNICKNSVPVSLVGVPLGGTWSGTGISPTGTFTPTSSMSGNITLTYSINQNGCTGTDQVVISITNAVNVSAGASQTVCDNANPVSMTGFSPAGGNWSGPGINSAGTFQPDSTLIGTQTLIYRVTQSNCTVQASKTITVKKAPNVEAGSDVTLCSNANPLQLSGFSPSGGTWSGSNLVSTGGLVTPSGSGSVVLTYSVTGNGCTGTASRVVTIIPAPEVDAGPAQNICGLGGNTPMEGYFPSGGTWSGTGISDAGVFSPLASQLGTTATVSYSLTQNGCTAISTKTINILNVPQIIPVAAASLQGCEGSAVPLQLNLQNPSLFTFRWKKDGVWIPGATAAFWMASSGGTYQAEAKVSSCTVPSEEKVVTLLAVPATPVITFAAGILTSSASTGNKWRKNGQDIPGATQNQYQPSESGIYSVVASNGSCLSDVSNAIPVTFTGNEKEVIGIQDIRVFPNPGAGKFFIEFKGNISKTIPLDLMDATGKVVWHEDADWTGQASPIEINLHGMASGIYWLKAVAEKRAILKKLIIQ